LDHGRRRLAAHVLDRVLVAQPVRPLHGVVHVPAPVVLAHVAERRADAALRRDGVAARRESLAERRGLQAPLGETERRAKAGTARADDDHIVRVVDELVLPAHGATANAIRRTANTLAIAIATWTNVDNASSTTFVPGSCT